jgi:hypothetical protein
MKEEHGQITIPIFDEDNSNTYEVSGGPGTPVRNLIDELYKRHLKRDRRPDDRLRCEDTGADVFQFQDMHLRDYVSQQCTKRSWLFAGGVGGA